MMPRPEPGLVYGDCRVVDEEDRTLAQSFFKTSKATLYRGRPLARLMVENFVSAAVWSEARCVSTFNRFLSLRHGRLVDRTANRAGADTEYVEQPPPLGYRLHANNGFFTARKDPIRRS